MAKGTVIVAICSAGIVILFCVMLYLMSTVNPPAEFNVANKKVLKQTTTSSSEPPDETGRRIGGIYFDDAGVLPIVDTVQYGLEKIDSDVIDFYRSTAKPVLKYQNKDRKVIPPLWPRATQEIIVNPTMHKVMPPIWPTTSVIIDTVISSIKSEKQNSTTKVETTLTSSTSEPTKPSVKPMKRRSVSNYVLDEDYDSVILKILDYNGQSKIEIKIWSDTFSQKIIGKLNGTRDLQNKSKHTLKSGRNVYHGTAESAKNTVITICANDSVLIEESEGTNVSELLNTISSLTTRDENDSNITDVLRAAPINETINEKKPTEMFLVNETKPMGENTNSSEFQIKTSRSNINITKHEISSNTANFSSEFDILFDAKTNNTEFNKRIFKEEENIATADTTRVNAPNKDKISITDIYPNNYTDLFIEGDSDMVY
ncbi:unnamed protein product [Arctia plantaginis]|uniref:Uncharacterized protein n=1 Tax=Arctia plantaginis TaxID=874455 RepID=A0A8S1A1J3_ARCPL|nr:unnamed protein product [Arctia plantaginis]